MRKCLLPASDFRVNVDNRYPVEEEGRVSPHEEQGQLLEEMNNIVMSGYPRIISNVFLFIF
jgi:hypothetical protein